MTVHVELTVVGHALTGLLHRVVGDPTGVSDHLGCVDLRFRFEMAQDGRTGVAEGGSPGLVRLKAAMPPLRHGNGAPSRFRRPRVWSWQAELSELGVAQFAFYLMHDRWASIPWFLVSRVCRPCMNQES